ncbi:Hypothetical protein A7982_09693 [Minicystis rosea]|nr:Hypothetical protein A7982_09693 [Minicystis rosea]
MTSLPRDAVGLGFRVEVAADLLADPSVVDFVEVVAEGCFASPAARREAAAIARVWPIVLHGVKLSLGSAEGVDLDRAKRLGALARELAAPVVTEHVAFVRAGGREIGHLTQIPFTREAVRVVARNVAAARRHLPDVPFHLENAAWTFRWPDDEIDEAAFYTEIVEATGCDLLLDLGNLYANAINAGADPFAVLERYPLERVAMIHLAGGVNEDGFYFDTHAHPVPAPVFDLLARVVDRAGAVPVVIERDDAFPPFDRLREELSRAREILGRAALDAASPRRHEASSSLVQEADVKDTAGAMAHAQAQVARMLTVVDEPPADDMRPFGEAAIRRSRDVLQEKRVDDALPILANLIPHREMVRPLARACLAHAPRAPAFTGIADAFRIARIAVENPTLAPAARLDLLSLRARFVGSVDDGSLGARVGPFVGRERLPSGKVVWAVKGLGSAAGVRIFETRG